MTGTAGRPRTSDTTIVHGARQALIANPRATMAEIARSAGVGMSAIYLRFPNRDALLHHFAEEGNRIYDEALRRVEAALDNDEEPRAVLERFITEITESGLHRLGLAISGTFARTPDDIAESTRLRDRGRRFVHTLHARQVLRPGVTWEDLGKMIEALSSITGADDDRTAILRTRMIDVVVTGLCAGPEPLAGEPAHGIDFRENRPPDSSPTASPR